MQSGSVRLSPDRFEEKTFPMAQWRRLLRRAGAILCALFGGFLLLRLGPALAAPDPVGPSAIIAIIAAGMFYLAYWLWTHTS
jgi:hypothetical protein